MSRVGKLPITLPADVKVTINPNQIVVNGKFGELSTSITDDVIVSIEDNAIIVKPKSDSRRSRAMWGMVRNILNNNVKGVQGKFEKRLEINGVGYRVAVDKNLITLSLGYSHEIKYQLPEGVEAKSEKPTSLSIIGIDKQLVGQVAAEIRALRKPEPYKGKGIRYENERVRVKEGKKK
jgi:large subunit ribosomal protein L6